MHVVSTVIDVAKALAGAVGWAQQFDKSRREGLATIFDAIAGALENFRELRKQGQKAPGICGELKQYANKLRDVASGTLPSVDIDRLAIELAGACEALQNLSTTAGPQRGQALYDEYLDQLAEGAGAFRGCATVLRGQR